MMNKGEAIRKELKAKLESITTADGYGNDPQILDGWLVHYLNNAHNQADRQINFPCVALQPSGEVVADFNGLNATPSRVFEVVGAVSVDDPLLVTDNIDSLLYDVRCSLNFIKESKLDSSAINIVLGDVDFKLPIENHDQYAYFTLKVSAIYSEEWKSKT